MNAVSSQRSRVATGQVSARPLSWSRLAPLRSGGSRETCEELGRRQNPNSLVFTEIEWVMIP